jgi:hypothetical protein
MKWFSSDRAKFIEYTLFVAAATWAASYFVLDERREKLFEAEKETLKTEKESLLGEIQTYKEKIVSLQDERDRYLGWLEKDERTFPALQLANTKLQEALIAANKNVESFRRDTSAQSEWLYSNSVEIKVGGSYIDPKTGAIIGLRTIFVSRTAEIRIRIPGKPAILAKEAAPADSWEYEFNKKQYLITIREVNYISDYIKATIQEVPPRQ